ncbi:MAG: hypothetical protein HC846_11135 [Blastocatellia bacterium]|nr:hypothetical protein [Blastocatellia bacterium]
MKYSDKNQPPAPIAKVILRNIETSESVSNVPMLLDTGSDITLLPKSFCEEIGVEISETEFLELEGFNNATSLAFYVRLEFIFLNKMFRGKFLVYESDEGLIGRDILNEFSIVFDGKSLSWYELD